MVEADYRIEFDNQFFNQEEEFYLKEKPLYKTQYSIDEVNNFNFDILNSNIFSNKSPVKFIAVCKSPKTKEKKENKFTIKKMIYKINGGN